MNVLAQAEAYVESLEPQSLVEATAEFIAAYDNVLNAATRELTQNQASRSFASIMYGIAVSLQQLNELGGHIAATD